jgi:hypothetical protein
LVTEDGFRMAESTTNRSRSQTRRKTAATDRSTAAKKAAATRARNRAAEASKRSTAARKAAETRRELARGPVERYASYAGRAVTIPVGAALVARDNVVATVGGVATKYSSRDKLERGLRARQRRVEAELRRFERRGERARARVGRDLRTLRGNVVTTRRDVGAQAGLVGSRVENIVQSGITAGTQAAAKAVERVTRVA